MYLYFIFKARLGLFLYDSINRSLCENRGNANAIVDYVVRDNDEFVNVLYLLGI